MPAVGQVQTLVCATCGTEFPRTVTRGYPPKNCESCKPKSRAGERARKRANGEFPPLLTAEERNEINRRSKELLPRLSPDVIAKMLEGVADGLTMRKSAALVRLAPRTLDRWLQKGRLEIDAWADEVDEAADDAEIPEPGIYGSFYLDAAEAIARREHKWLKALWSANEKDSQWKRLSWLLTATAPGDYAVSEKVQRLELSGSVNVQAKAVLGVADVFDVLRSAGALAELEGEDSRPRAALPAASEVLAESADGIPAAGSVSTP